MNHRNEEKLDPRLREYLAMLRPVPRRDPLAAARAKANFLVELEVLFEPPRSVQVKPPVSSRMLGYVRERLMRPFSSLNSFPRTALSLSSVLLFFAVLLFGWVSITAQAAESAVPGDTLYSFKTSMEEVQLALSGDLDKQVGLYLEFATHRLQEIELLVDSGRYQKAVALSTRFQLNILKAIEITNDLAKVDPARAAQRRTEINSKLASFTAQLNELMGKLPPVYQPAFNGVFPPISSTTPAPSMTGSTQTPVPATEQDTRRDEPSNTPTVPKDASDPVLNNGGDSGPDKGTDPGKPPESGSGKGVEQYPGGNNEGINPDNNGGTIPGDNPEYNPGFAPESDNQGLGTGQNNEQANPDNSQPGASNVSPHEGQHSGDNKNIPPKSSRFIDSPPVILQ